MSFKNHQSGVIPHLSPVSDGTEESTSVLSCWEGTSASLLTQQSWMDRYPCFSCTFYPSLTPSDKDSSCSKSTDTAAEHQRTPPRLKLQAGSLVEWLVLVQSPLDAAKENPTSCSHEDLNVFIVNKPPLSSFIDLHGLAKVEGFLFAGF